MHYPIIALYQQVCSLRTTLHALALPFLDKKRVVATNLHHFSDGLPTAGWIFLSLHFLAQISFFVDQADIPADIFPGFGVPGALVRSSH